MNGPTNLLQVITLGYLVKYCAGARRARTVARIAGDLAALSIDCDARAVRDALADLSAAGFPVGTTYGNPAGAFVCETGRDFAVANQSRPRWPPPSERMWI
jgi:hypothetical protein